MLETVFSIVICRQSGNKWQSELFLAIFDLRSSIVLTFSIAADIVGIKIIIKIYNFSLIMTKKVSLIMEYHNHTQQTNPWHREEEPALSLCTRNVHRLIVVCRLD